MKIDTKILKKNPAKQLQNYIKKVIQNNQVGLTPEMQELLNIFKSINVINYINERQKSHDHLKNKTLTKPNMPL